MHVGQAAVVAVLCLFDRFLIRVQPVFRWYVPLCCSMDILITAKMRNKQLFLRKTWRNKICAHTSPETKEKEGCRVTRVVV